MSLFKLTCEKCKATCTVSGYYDPDTGNELALDKAKWTITSDELEVKECPCESHFSIVYVGEEPNFPDDVI